MIGCKELDRFKVKSSYAGAKGEGEHVVKFLNQLQRCDEINIRINYSSFWSFHTNELMPKFRWNKLALESYLFGDKYDFYDDNAIQNITALCQASSPNAEAELAFKTNEIFEQSFDLILKNCRVITDLTLNVSDLPLIPTQATQLRNLERVETFRIHAQYMQLKEFSDFARILPNVTFLDLFFPPGERVKIPAEAVRSLQPFFDQITTLSWSWSFLSTSPRSFNIDRLQFENLNTLIITIFDCCWKKRASTLVNFCLRNPTVRRLVVYFDATYDEKPMNLGLVKLLDHIKGTSITTCKVTIEGGWTQAEYEMGIFGRSLTDDERRFLQKLSSSRIVKRL